MSGHVLTLGRDGDGWDVASCSCGWSIPGVPGAEEAATFWAEHLLAEVHLELGLRLTRARFVAEHWRDQMMGHELTRAAAHPLAMVLGALNGETDPDNVGLNPEVHDAYRGLS